MITELFGTVGAVLTTASFLPQALLILRTRNTDGISLLMYAMFTAGVACWLIYALILGLWPMIIANIITVALAGLILALKAQNTLRAQDGGPGGE